MTSTLQLTRAKWSTVDLPPAVLSRRLTWSAVNHDGELDAVPQRGTVPGLCPLEDDVHVVLGRRQPLRHCAVDDGDLGQARVVGVLAVVHVKPGVCFWLYVHLENVERDDVTRLRAERLQQETDVDRSRRKKAVLPVLC